jgi:CDP-diacylglycerol--glycerol-3-phosphate 3-phosphatidyltransferase
MTTLPSPPVPLTGFGPGSLRTWPDLVTLVRTALAVGIGAVGVARADLALIAVAYAVYWAGDIADGWLARRIGQETRAGAVLDIVCDRACTSLLCVGLLAQLPAVLPVAVVFLLSFMALDTMLSLAFLCWPVLGPNYFGRVDRQVYRLNWSPPAKALNTAAVVLLVVAGLYTAALVVASGVVLLKVWSALRVGRLLKGGHS